MMSSTSTMLILAAAVRETSRFPDFQSKLSIFLTFLDPNRRCLGILQRCFGLSQTCGISKHTCVVILQRWKASKHICKTTKQRCTSAKHVSSVTQTALFRNEAGKQNDRSSLQNGDVTLFCGQTCKQNLTAPLF